MNMLAVKDKQPITFTLKRLIEEFVSFQEELYTKEYNHLLAKANDRLEIVDGLIKATDVIDLIIEILRGSDSIKQAKACLIQGNTEGINFKSQKSKKQASALDFTERQAEAILAMPLSRLIGLELLKLHQESDLLHNNIAEYTNILGDIGELHKIIITRLKEYKKKFGRERLTELDNLTKEKYVEEIKEEDIYVLVDRFGYVKSVDSASYSRLTDDTLADYSHIIPIHNTDRLCIFTEEGNMYQIKAMGIPKGRSRDKGVLIQSLCKVGHENILLYIAAEDLFESQLFFATRNGFVKQVSGVSFDTNRSVIASTKLDEGDSIVNIVPLSVMEVINPDQKVILITKKGLSLGFPLYEVSELKKASRGIKGITLDDDDTVLYAAVAAPDCEKLALGQHSYDPRKIRTRKRAAKGQKAKIEI